MSRRSHFTAITAVPRGVTRRAAVDWLHDHRELIRLNPLVLRFDQSSPPATAPSDERECTWYEITDQINYGLVKSEVTYKACFNDLPNGVQTHVYAPAGLDIRERWTVCGNEVGEPREILELGIDAPRDGLYVREDVQMRCNVFLSRYVKRNLSKAHKVVIQRVGALAETMEDSGANVTTTYGNTGMPSRPISRNESIVSMNPSPYQHPSSLYSGYSIPDSLQRPAPQSLPGSATTPCYCVGRHDPECSQYVRTPVHPRLDNWSPAVDDKDLPRLPRDSGLTAAWHHIEIPAMDDLTPVEARESHTLAGGSGSEGLFVIPRKPISPRSPLGLRTTSEAFVSERNDELGSPTGSRPETLEALRPQPLMTRRVVSDGFGA
ncbi:hypothetical protein LTR95_012277 [Oleoguttula sp. CCFEE 5521]